MRSSMGFCNTVEGVPEGEIPLWCQRDSGKAKTRY